MVRLAVEPHAVAAQPHDRGHDPDLDPGRLQRRPLLDVQLEVGADLADAVGSAGAVEVVPGRGHRVAERRPARIDPVAEPGDVLARERPAPEEGGVEARPLLVHERDDPERPAGLEALLPEQAHRMDGGDDPERAVEASSRRDGVEVRPDEDRRAAARLPASEQVAGGVDLDVEAEFAHAVRDPCVGLEERRRPRHACDAPVLAADPRELLEARGDRACGCLLAGCRSGGVDPDDAR